MACSNPFRDKCVSGIGRDRVDRARFRTSVFPEEGGPRSRIECRGVSDVVRAVCRRLFSVEIEGANRAGAARESSDE